MDIRRDETLHTHGLNDLPQHHFGVILADPPWHFKPWSLEITSNHPSKHYQTMTDDEIYALPVQELAADDCVLFLWIVWPMLEHGMKTIAAWGFKYKTCAFSWIKANGRQINLFEDSISVDMTTGYWTRANSEVCLLATRGSPKRLNDDVRQAIIEPRRQHSRKPQCVYERIERLVDGPYLELFARQKRLGWISWGNETEKFQVAE